MSHEARLQDSDNLLSYFLFLGRKGYEERVLTNQVAKRRWTLPSFVPGCAHVQASALSTRRARPQPGVPGLGIPVTQPFLCQVSRSVDALLLEYLPCCSVAAPFLLLSA